VRQINDVKGCCPLDCQDTCAWVATVENGRVVKVRGARDHPFTRGALCAKVNDYQERTYAPDRLLRPLRRIGPKGAGEFAPIGWDEAIETIAGRFAAIIASDGPEALMPHSFMGSMGVVQRRALLRLFNALGATRVHGSFCGQAGNTLIAEGHQLGFDPEELVHSELILVWGSNDLTACHHHWHFVEEARRANGATVVCIDPRRTRTAKACDRHLAIRPGTDAILAAGIGHVILDEGLADLDFARDVATDLDAYADQVRQWPPDRVSSICDIAADDIVWLARSFAKARPAAIRSAIGPQQTIHGESFVRGLSALAIIGGHWQRPGGGLFIETYPVFHDGKAARPDLVPGEPRSLDMARLGETLTSTTLQPPIKGLMIWGTNPAVVQVNAGLVRKGLAREDLFTVVLEHFLTDTARYADVILPSTTQLEHFDILGSWGHQYISLNNPAIPPVGEAKSHGEVLRLIANQMGLTHPALHESDEAIACSALPEDVDLALLKERAWLKRPPAGPRFKLPKGKLQLAGPIPEQISSGAPGTLRLLTPKAHYFLNSSFANMPRQRLAQARPTLDINPSDAAARGFSESQEVIVRNSQGAIRAWLHVTDDIRPGVVSLPGKWWSFPTETGAVGNVLTPSSWSPGGQPAFNETFVDVVLA
jgi:anaerobic selenocysteine-containing dehydrogenase